MVDQLLFKPVREHQRDNSKHIVRKPPSLLLVSLVPEARYETARPLVERHRVKVRQPIKHDVVVLAGARLEILQKLWTSSIFGH
jgi:hypothetical protein